MISDEIKCRLCEDRSIFKFSEKILNKFNINFYECTKCYSLQTEKPYWLKESYEEWLTKYDTGVYARVEKSSLVTLTICKIFGFNNLLDIGGGDGLFCRIMRDYYINCFSNDKFSKNIYAREFIQPNFENPDLVTSFEAVEHFSDPNQEFDKIFKLNPKAVLLTTSIYEQQGQKWNYLELQTGQHIFFYSKESVKLIGKKYDYNVFFLESGFILMTSKKIKYNDFLIYFFKKILIREKMFFLLRFIKIFFKSKGYEKDYNNIKN